MDELICMSRALELTVAERFNFLGICDVVIPHVTCTERDDDRIRIIAEIRSPLPHPPGTLRDWEQGCAEPDQTARAYLLAGHAGGFRVRTGFPAGHRNKG